MYSLYILFGKGAVLLNDAFLHCREGYGYEKLEEPTWRCCSGRCFDGGMICEDSAVWVSWATNALTISHPSRRERSNGNNRINKKSQLIFQLALFCHFFFKTLDTVDCDISNMVAMVSWVIFCLAKSLMT